jgi:hypothetical protein
MHQVQNSIPLREFLASRVYIKRAWLLPQILAISDWGNAERIVTAWGSTFRATLRGFVSPIQRCGRA